MNYDAIILGGGASGLLSASALAERGRHVALLEAQGRVGRKLLSTGNGRCNLTNRSAGPSDYHGDLQAAKAALEAWPPRRVEALFLKLGIPCVADGEGRVYPMSRQAASVLDALRLSCDERGVDTLTDFEVTALEVQGGRFCARARDGRQVSGRCALVSTGGLAAPKLGASGIGYRLLERLGHRSTPRCPAIAPLKTPPEAVRGLKGIRAESTIALLADGRTVRRERGEILFTESGLSGIAAMQLAGAVNAALRQRQSCQCLITLMPEAMDLAARARDLPRRPMEDFLNGILPRRLGQMLVRAAGIDATRPAGRLSPAEIQALARRLTGWALPVTGTLGYEQAQVTSGGIDLDDFDRHTLQSRLVPGLFAAGEVLNVDGDCGGFNLQWAWSSAMMAAEGMGSRQ